ncbi:MAG: ACT domain-containing protein [Lachnospiraceae bacterium]|nr:ACT domain-containing protein [Lachnospiraceae bacterium]MBQ6995384.1 ACT domain-containing protein [Lachnospiraceae bacterium]
MEIKKYSYDFTVCKVKNLEKVDMSQEFCFIGKTDEELSVVCLTEFVPEKTMEREDGWKAFRIQGVLDFSLIGILSKISTILAENKIGIFAISTYNTDYILTKADKYETALKVLEEAGYEIVL